MPIGVYPRSRESNENRRQTMLDHFRTGYSVWNKGLKKEIDSRVMMISKKNIGHISAKRGQTKETNKSILLASLKLVGHLVSKETRRKISNSMKLSEKFQIAVRKPERIQKIIEHNHKTSRGVNGYFYSEKNGQMMFYRSSWELQAFQILEQLSEVTNYSYEAIRIPYTDKDGISHTAIPDLLVKYQSGKTELIEIKPQYMISKDLESTRLKLNVMENFARLKGFVFSIWSDNKFVNI